MDSQNLGMGIDVAAQNPGIFSSTERVDTVQVPGKVVEAMGNTTNIASNVITSPESGFEAQNGPMMGGDAKQRDAGLENAMGIVTVGASGVMPEEPNVPGMTAMNLPNTVEIPDDQLERVPEEAKDGEKMEKAWMKRAQEVVAETRKDPSKRLVQVALLREEYMRKRFNRILGEHN